MTYQKGGLWHAACAATEKACKDQRLQHGAEVVLREAADVQAGRSAQRCWWRWNSRTATWRARVVSWVQGAGCSPVMTSTTGRHPFWLVPWAIDEVACEMKGDGNEHCTMRCATALGVSRGCVTAQGVCCCESRARVRMWRLAS